MMVIEVENMKRSFLIFHTHPFPSVPSPSSSSLSLSSPRFHSTEEKCLPFLLSPSLFIHIKIDLNWYVFFFPSSSSFFLPSQCFLFYLRTRTNIMIPGKELKWNRKKKVESNKDDIFLSFPLFFQFPFTDTIRSFFSSPYFLNMSG